MAALCDFALLTVLRPELDALLNVLSTSVNGVQFHSTLGQVFTVSISVPSSTDQAIKGIIVPIDGVGRIEGALTTATMLKTWRPEYILLVGIAGGIEVNGVNIGDIIVSTEIVDYAIQKVTPNGIELRPRRYATSATLLRIAKGLSKDNGYSYTYDGTQVCGHVHFGPIASGDQIVASSVVTKALLEKEPHLLGVEMEGAGLAAAVSHEEQPISFIVIRGIADLADEAKSDLWIDKACAAAASFAVDFLTAAAIS